MPHSIASWFAWPVAGSQKAERVPMEDSSAKWIVEDAEEIDDRSQHSSASWDGSCKVMPVTLASVSWLDTAVEDVGKL
jgi:hypothetical protein